MDEVVDLTKGGIAVNAFWDIGFVKEYATHPSVLHINCREIEGAQLLAVVPTNTKVIILGVGLPTYHYNWLASYAQRKNIPFLIRKTTQAAYETLKGFFPNSNTVKVLEEEVKETQAKGRLAILIDHIDWSKSNADNGRVLFQKANQSGIKTTLGSVTQWVAIQRRKKSGTAVPKSVRSELDISVEMLDNTIKELTDMREFLIITVEENRILKTKLERFKKAMED